MTEPTAAPAAPPALAGITVLDLSSVGPAARAGRMLADYGATVIKVAPVPRNAGVQIQPPFYAYSATGGITFTFGGLRINAQAEVIGTDWRPIPGLYACGEMVGGLYYDNYPAGTGLVSGATFGRIAGKSAATRAPLMDQPSPGRGAIRAAQANSSGAAQHREGAPVAGATEGWVP